MTARRTSATASGTAPAVHHVLGAGRQRAGALRPDVDGERVARAERALDVGGHVVADHRGPLRDRVQRRGGERERARVGLGDAELAGGADRVELVVQADHLELAALHRPGPVGEHADAQAERPQLGDRGRRALGEPRLLAMGVALGDARVDDGGIELAPRLDHGAQVRAPVAGHVRAPGEHLVVEALAQGQVPLPQRLLLDRRQRRAQARERAAPDLRLDRVEVGQGRVEVEDDGVERARHARGCYACPPPSPSRSCARPTARRRRCGASTWRSARGSSSGCSGPTARASRRS